MSLPIVAADLTKIYQEGRTEVLAVDGVDLTLRPGEFVGLFGPSGSGKTTLLSLLGCILRATRGSLRLFGTEVTGLGEKELPALRRRHVTFVFQGFNLFPALTASENIVLILRLKGVKAGERKAIAQRLLEQVGLGDRADFLPRDLSGGQKQRVAIARALAADAPLILADEPTANLDHHNGRNTMEILRGLARDHGKCVVAATHDNRIEDLFDRILFMEDGRIVQEKQRSQ